MCHPSSGFGPGAKKQLNFFPGKHTFKAHIQNICPHFLHWDPLCKAERSEFCATTQGWRPCLFALSPSSAIWAPSNLVPASVKGRERRARHADYTDFIAPLCMGGHGPSHWELAANKRFWNFSPIIMMENETLEMSLRLFALWVKHTAAVTVSREVGYTSTCCWNTSFMIRCKYWRCCS